ncbi:LysR family transcriptional regulator [Trabulsiella odontotermitis]|uniref:LysR family transcriptional regulator n=1 Tax=Trabulsiella odontotermitis TaxID=379893 RepID=A0A0L0GS77_9ENTR|nr:LysR family transcriptional regulator [Trabulsiella odontotermitis]KNC91709.1 LysR family transcriptional regulator [Trabulsiella odontotermitis]
MKKNAPSIQDIQAFIAVAQYASFTRAAEFFGTGKAGMGKAVQRLEEHLGTRLFQRTTRAVHLTEDGETYLAASQAALEGLKEAEQALAARSAEPIGRVRIDLPAGFGRLLIPSFASLRKKHPKVTLDVALTDRFSDAVAEGWDIVVRIGDLPVDSEMTVRKLCNLQLGLYASPGYLARRSPITSVADLASHDAVVFRGPSGKQRPWKLYDGIQVRELSPSPVMVLADGQALVDASINGIGISQIYDRVARPHVDAGRLVHILASADVQGPPVHALIPVGHRMSAKTRAVLNHLAAAMKEQEDEAAPKKK